VEREPRVIRINELSLQGWDSPEGRFFMDCSKGTYVRTVFHDLGQKLDCGGHLTSLRRTKINDFSIEGVPTLEEIETMGTGEFQSLLIPVREAVPAHVL
jgi:tRNA pseudouridine55 synthase